MSIKLPPLLVPERIALKKSIESHKCAIDVLTNLLAKGQSEVSRYDIYDALIAREKLGSTSISNGISIPRAHLHITNPRIALLVLEEGLNINAVDHQAIRLFFAILIPETEREKYSALLSQLYSALIDEKSIKVFTETSNTQALADYFEKLIDNILSKNDTKQTPVTEESTS